MKKNLLIKILSLALMLTSIFVLAACNPAAENPPNEKQVWLPYTMLDHYENCKRTYYYDEYGNQTKMVKEDLNGNLQATWLYEYDDNQNLIKRSVDTGDGTPFVQLLQTYDDKGNLIEKREINTSRETVYTYQYDEQNRLVSESRNGNIGETYIYEADGSYRAQKTSNADEYSLYHPDGRIKEIHFGPDRKWVYVYNAEGILVECITYSGENITERSVYHLDENGNMIKQTDVDASGDEKVAGEYEYKLYTVKEK